MSEQARGGGSIDIPPSNDHPGETWNDDSDSTKNHQKANDPKEDTGLVITENSNLNF